MTHRPRWVAVLAICLIVSDAFTSINARTQTFVTPRGEAQNVRFEQRDAGVLHIFYDLSSSDPRAVFTVMLEASQDSGTTFGMRPQSVTGDTGEGVTPGAGKRIVWDSGKDVERVQIDRFRFRVVATGGPLAVEPPAPALPKPVEGATATPPKPAGATPPPSAPAKPAKKKGINPLIWVGAAGAVAGGAALALGGGPGPGPDPPPPPPVSTIAGSWVGTVASSPTVPFGGGGYCDYTVTLNDMRLSFDVDASLIVSNVQLRHTLNEVAIACPFQPYPPNQHNYELTGQQVSSSSVVLNMRNTTGAPTNNVQISATLQSSNTLSARLTFDRFLYPGEGPPVNWRVTVTPTMTRTR